jgi:hyaluronan synthase
MLIPVSAYGAVALSRIGLQIITSAIERKRKVPIAKFLPASLIVPTFNEPVNVFQRAMKSLKEIDYPELEVIIVDDGSNNHSVYQEIAQSFGFTYIYQKNAGKREAMFNGLNHISPRSQIVMFSDSDTLWDPHAAKELVNVLYADDKTGAVTGEVAVENYKDNLMTRIIGMRYHMAFAYERASQSFFKTVTCISGPLGAYRREVLDEIKYKFIHQEFLGKKCTYGDDRHLTNLVLGEGWKVRYASKALCHTQAPQEFFKLIKQQSRWGKSYWRELVWQAKTLPKHGPYLWYDFVVTAVLPFLLIGSVINHIVHAIATSTYSPLTALLATIVIVSLLRVIDPMIRKRNLWYLAFVAYAVIYFLVLLPVKVFALFTLNTGKWGTRSALPEKAQEVLTPAS